MRRSKGCKDELEKLTRNDSNLTLTIKLKAAAPKKLRLWVTGYSQAGYYYTLSNRDMNMSYKIYGISKEIDIAAYTNHEQIWVASMLENPEKSDVEENTEGISRTLEIIKFILEVKLIEEGILDKQ